MKPFPLANTAIVHVPSPNMEQCQRTFVNRVDIDHSKAMRQHTSYCEVLRDHGIHVITLDVNRDLSDCVFVEDTAIVLDEAAVLCSMGAESRRAEPVGIEHELRKYRTIYRIELPATIDGGDVLRIGHTLLVGRSMRTNEAGIHALQGIVQRYGYSVMTVPVRRCLHLKTACTALDMERLLINSQWVDAAAIKGFEFVHVPPDEPTAGNILPLGSTICMSATHVQTADRISKLGFDVLPLDLSEFAKAEGGVTCMSILFNQN